MIVPDLNLLIYAYDAGSPWHAPAKAWWAQCLGGTEPVGLAAVVAFGFVRLTTSTRVFEQPMRVGEAAAHVRGWLDQPCVQWLDASREHAGRTLAVLEEIGAGGNLVTDAQIAALALEHGGVVHTADAGFARFPGLRWNNPLPRRAGRDTA